MQSKIDLSTVRQSEQPFPLELMGDIEEKLNNLGYDVDIVQECSIGGGKAETPSWMNGENNPVKEAIVEGWGFPFDLEQLASQRWDNAHLGSGKEHVTTFFNHLELTVMETVEFLDKTQQLQDSIEVISDILPKGVKADNVMAYAVWTYAKGWVAEKIITDTDRFAKLWVTNDMYGQDARDLVENKEVQIKSVTFDSRRKDHVYYQWDMRGGLHISDDLRTANTAAVGVTGAVPKTKAYKSYQGANDSRPSRYLWW